MTPDVAAALILLVEDFADAREMYHDYLTFSGFRVETASDGHEAVEKARALLPDLILMDLLMPRMTGLEAVAAMRTMPALAGTAVFAITAMAFEQERHMAYAAGFDVVITKPFSRRHLMEAIQRQFPGLELGPLKVPA